jgi:hypothetical protein
MRRELNTLTTLTIWNEIERTSLSHKSVNDTSGRLTKTRLGRAYFQRPNTLAYYTKNVNNSKDRLTALSTNIRLEC